MPPLRREVTFVLSELEAPQTLTLDPDTWKTSYADRTRYPLVVPGGRRPRQKDARRRNSEWDGCGGRLERTPGDVVEEAHATAQNSMDDIWLGVATLSTDVQSSAAIPFSDGSSALAASGPCSPPVPSISSNKESPVPFVRFSGQLKAPVGDAAAPSSGSVAAPMESLRRSSSTSSMEAGSSGVCCDHCSVSPSSSIYLLRPSHFEEPPVSAHPLSPTCSRGPLLPEESQAADAALSRSNVQSSVPRANAPGNHGDGSESSEPFGDDTDWERYRDSKEFRGGKGWTVWYKTSGPFEMSHPPPSLRASVDEIYTHFNETTSRQKYWALNGEHVWVHVHAGDKQSSDPARRLSIQRNGDPSWVTRETYSVYRSRRKKGAASTRRSPGAVPY